MPARTCLAQKRSYVTKTVNDFERFDSATATALLRDLTYVFCEDLLAGISKNVKLLFKFL